MTNRIKEIDEINLTSASVSENKVKIFSGENRYDSEKTETGNINRKTSSFITTTNKQLK